MKRPDFLLIASTSASVSFKTALTKEELCHALLTGEVPANRRPHLRTMLEEAPRPVIKGLLEQVTPLTVPGGVEANVKKLAAGLGIPQSADRWQASARSSEDARSDRS
jgi:hypothetical protein